MMGLLFKRNFVCERSHAAMSPKCFIMHGHQLTINLAGEDAEILVAETRRTPAG